jgi:uncharacterized delta-60 repeat protein
MAYRSLRKRVNISPALRARVRAHVEQLEVRALLSAGSPDTNWGNQGQVLIDFGTPGAGRGDIATAVAMQDDGKIVTVGQSADFLNGTTLFAVSRNLPDGSIDTGFGTNGRVLTDFGANVNSLAQAVAIDSTGKILVAGFSGLGGNVLSVARYNSDGSLDINFSDDGKQTFPSVADSVSEVSMVIDAQDRAVIGFTGAHGNGTDMQMIRVNSAGFQDGGFGGGAVVTDVGLVDISAGVAIDAAGNVVQAGVSNGRLISTRVSGSGALDTQTYGSINSPGVFVDTTSQIDTVRSIMIDANGTLLAAGSVAGNNPVTNSPTQLFKLDRLAANGSGIVDSVVAGFSNDNSNWTMGVEADGQILIAGDTFNLDDFAQKFVIARFNSDLDQDMNFGNGGGLYTSSVDPSSIAGIISDSQGKILAAGFMSGDAGDSDFLLARFDPDIVAATPTEVTADANARPDEAPYVLFEGQTLTLAGAGSVTTGGETSFGFVGNQRRVTSSTGGGTGGTVVLEWDLDNDGQFDDATGPAPVFSAAALDGPASITISVRATDASDANNVAVDSTTIQVNNIAPNASINLPSVANEGQPLTIGSTVQDASADLPTETYAWSVTQGAMVIATGTASNVTFTPADDGAYTVTLTVKDHDNASVTKTSTLNVANVNPTASIAAVGATSVNEGDSVAFTSNASDVPADTITYAWSVKKNGVGFGSATTQNFAFTPDDNASYEVSLTVSDGDGGSVTSNSIIVTASNVAPTANPTTADTTGVRGEVRTVNLAATDAGSADAAAGFTYTIDWADGSPVQTVNPGTTTATHTFTANGTFNVSVTAKDHDNAASTPIVVPMVTQTAALSGGILSVSGGTAADKIRISPAAGGGVFVGVSDVGSGANEFSQTFTGTINRIVVNGQAGDDQIDATLITSTPVEMYGGAGADKLQAGGGADIVVGGDGDDKIAGNGGRDLLIGGNGADKISGDSDDDVLIGGYTAHDGNVTALRGISAEWNSGRTYAQRVGNISGSAPMAVRLNGTNYFTANVTTWDDGAIDTLAGNAGSDWFFANIDTGVKDKLADASSTEFAFDVNPVV